ncbi:MAG: hypothetical protein ACPKQO_01440 [Nitrososphaeraceae archaeon]
MSLNTTIPEFLNGDIVSKYMKISTPDIEIQRKDAKNHLGFTMICRAY